MLSLLSPLPPAYADTHDNPNAMLLLVIICCGLLVLVAILGMLPLLIARRRRSRHAEAIRIGSLLWAFAAAGFLLYAAFSHYRASTEYTTLVQSGYYDPDNPAAQPRWPWPGALLLALAYFPLIGVSLGSTKSAPPPARHPPPSEDPPPDFHKNN